MGEESDGDDRRGGEMYTYILGLESSFSPTHKVFVNSRIFSFYFFSISKKLWKSMDPLSTGHGFSVLSLLLHIQGLFLLWKLFHRLTQKCRWGWPRGTERPEFVFRPHLVTLFSCSITVMSCGSIGKVFLRRVFLLVARTKI